MQASGRVWLSKKQRNDLFMAVVEAGINANELHLDIKENGFHIINHVPSKSKLWIDPTGERPGGVRSYRIQRFVGTDPMWFHDVTTWDDVLESVTSWTCDVKDYVDTPDLWTEIRRQREFFKETGYEKAGNTPFTKDERQQIAAQLREIKEQVKEQFALSSEQMELVEEKLDEAVEASGRMGRKDWLIYFLGTITALTIAATVPAGIGEHIFIMVINALGHLFTGGSEPPQILG